MTASGSPEDGTTKANSEWTRKLETELHNLRAREQKAKAIGLQLQKVG